MILILFRHELHCWHLEDHTVSFFKHLSPAWRIIVHILIDQTRDPILLWPTGFMSVPHYYPPYHCPHEPIPYRFLKHFNPLLPTQDRVLHHSYWITLDTQVMDKYYKYMQGPCESPKCHPYSLLLQDVIILKQDHISTEPLWRPEIIYKLNDIRTLYSCPYMISWWSVKRHDCFTYMEPSKSNKREK
jgi:hypothetical protein